MSQQALKRAQLPRCQAFPKGVKHSQGAKNSQGIMYSQGVKHSQGIMHSQVVKHYQGVMHSRDAASKVLSSQNGMRANMEPQDNWKSTE